MRDDMRRLRLHPECSAREIPARARPRVEVFVEVPADDAAVAVAEEDECAEPAEAHGRALGCGDAGAGRSGEEARDVRCAVGLRRQWDEKAFEEVCRYGFEDAERRLVVVVPLEPCASEREDAGQLSVGGVGAVGQEQPVQDHADQVCAAGLGGTEFDDRAEEVVQVHFTAVVATDGEVRGFAVAEYLVVQDLGFLGVLWGGFRRREREVEDVFEGSLVA